MALLWHSLPRRRVLTFAVLLCFCFLACASGEGVLNKSEYNPPQKVCNKLIGSFGPSFKELLKKLGSESVLSGSPFRFSELRANTTTSTCPKSCSGNGICKDGKCLCQPGIEGADCSIDMCEHLGRCSGHGRCLHAECFCDPGFTGPKCDTITGCTSNCSAHGICKNGRCFCDPGFSGAACKEKVKCKNGCTSHGVCINGTCACNPGWAEDDCSLLTSVKPCVHDCGGVERGECREGKCFCLPGFSGEGCSKKLECLGDCHGHGSCQFGLKCVCDPGWLGKGCEAPALCPSQCHGHGSCQNGKCFCRPGYGGQDCKDEAVCLNDCSARGLCVSGTCHCETGRSGPDCSMAVKATDRYQAAPHGCPSGCSGHGVCATGITSATGDLQGECLCDVGYSGLDCAAPAVCPGKFQPAEGGQGFCSGHGVCSQGSCSCFPGFTGPACQLTSSPLVRGGCAVANCSGNGVCSMGKCFCTPGFTGPACATATSCPSNCSHHGLCSRGKCFCKPGYSGAACQHLSSCPSDCSNHGVCINGGCVCEFGYSGADCGSSPTCASQPCVHGFCRGGKCLCEEGFSGANCDLPTESLALQVGGGSSKCLTPCLNGVCSLVKSRLLDGGDQAFHLAYACVCRSGFRGSDCSQKDVALGYSCSKSSCLNGICSGAGLCLCNKGFSGDKCDVEGASKAEKLAGSAASSASSAFESPKQKGELRKIIKSTSLNATCLYMKQGDALLWQAFKEDRAAKLSEALAVTGKDLKVLQNAASFLETSEELKPICADTCTPAHGRCFNGACVCHAGVDAPFCLGGAVLAASPELAARSNTIDHTSPETFLIFGACLVIGAAFPYYASKRTL